MFMCGRLFRNPDQKRSVTQTANTSVASLVRGKLFGLKEVLGKNAALRIVLEDHKAHHDGHNAAEPRLQKLYVIYNLRAKIMAISGENCPLCKVYAPIPKKPPMAILTRRRGELVMFDLTKFYVTVYSL